MEVFFCISGFLITRTLLQSIAVRRDWAVHYLKKRALRIWPAYYVSLLFALGVSLCLAPLSAPQSLVWNGDLLYLLKTALFLQYTEFYGSNVMSDGAIPTFGHSWSVALEEQFYVAILVLIFLRHRYRLFGGLRILIPLLALLPLTQLARHIGFNGWTLLGRTDGFLLGIMLAFSEPLIARCGTAIGGFGRILTWAMIIAPIPLLLPYLAAHGDWESISAPFRTGLFNPYFAFAAFGFGLLTSIVFSPSTHIHGLLRLRALRYFGTISYSTYLFHVPVLLLVKLGMHWVGLDAWWLYAIGVPAVFAMSGVSYRLIERPFLQMKNRLTPSTSILLPADTAVGASKSATA